jgi:DNA modification methylase
MAKSMTEQRFQLHEGNCLDVLKQYPDNYFDSVVTDPPYGLAFMGKKWDYDVPSVEIWTEVFRVLKPGGHLLAFAGTRTQHRMAVNIEDAGFEIRDMIAWVYGCLSEDTEILTSNGWERYNKNIDKGLVLAYIPEHDKYEWQSVEDLFLYQYNDTAYRIVSDRTDQIVSRNHRCLVERGGRYVFRYAETLERQETIPILEGLQGLLNNLSMPDKGTSESQSVLQQRMCAKESKQDQATIGAERSSDSLRELRQGSMEAERMDKKEQEHLLQQVVQGQRCNRADIDSQQIRSHRNEVSRDRIKGCKESSVEGRGDLLQAQGQVCKSKDQVCEMPEGVFEDGAKGWICDGTQAECSNGNRQTVDADGVRASCEPRCYGQQAGEPNAVCDECRPQEIRASRHTRPDLARVEPIHYKGKVWCVKVASGAFVARRNGKVFITGNSGFPKSLDVSKAIDKASGAEREVVGSNPNHRAKSGVAYEGVYAGGNTGSANITAPSTEAAKHWEGYGTALKPALEPVTLARKPFSESNTAQNILTHGVGALNIDDCRVDACGDNLNGGRYSDKKNESDGNAYGKGMNKRSKFEFPQPLGRWPANVVHDGSDEVRALFPESKGQQGDVRQGIQNTTGQQGNHCYGNFGPHSEFKKREDKDTSAARFFYCAKTSRKDREEGLDAFPSEDASSENDGVVNWRNHHPTVKPTDLMRYLVRLVTPHDGIVLDPFMGSGSTGKAAMLEGKRFVGCDLDPEYVRIAQARCAYALTKDQSPVDVQHDIKEKTSQIPDQRK